MGESKSTLRSKFVGALALATVALLVGSWAVTGPGHDLHSLLVRIAPHPRDHVRIVEGTPYTVPAGKLFTVRAISATGDQPSDVKLLIDGQSVGVLRPFAAVFAGDGVTEIPFGPTARPGEVVTLAPLFVGGSDQAVVFGYLSDG